MKDIKAIIFDMDGVIFDTEKSYLDIWTRVFHKYGYKLDQNIYISLMGTGRNNVMKVFKEKYGEHLPIIEMYKEKDKILMDVIKKGDVPIKDGAQELLLYLKRNNFKIALATSARRNRLDVQIEMHDIFRLFDVIVCGDDVKNGKPDPEIFLKAAEKISVNPENCIVIEDSLAGIKAAYKGGMNGFHVQDLKIADEEILRYCTKNFMNLNEIKGFISLNIVQDIHRI